MSSKVKAEHKYQNKLSQRKRRIKELTGDSDFAWLKCDNSDIDVMSDQEILKEYKHYKKANPNGLNWEEL